jgi:CheY-like chemotaxis protein
MTGEQPYSLVIIDECMPGMGGFEAAAEMRRIAGGLPIVLLSFDAKPGDATLRREIGLSGYAVKPVARAQLLHLVCHAMAVQEYFEPRPVEFVVCREKEPVKPARLLVAEDSADNRLLVRAYLKGSPYQLTFEEDGKAAVDRLAITDFDLILMDVRMPVMDGLDATRAIRAIERERGAAAIPIIALTANASLEDMERSRKAGCNAHLCKPISKLELLSAIEKHRRQVKPVDTAQSGSRDAIRIEMPVELEDIVPGYLVSRKKEVSEMTELLAACDFERLSILSHNLKGTARGYGFPDLVKMGSALEQSANQMDSGTLSTQITDLGNYLQRVELALAGQPVYEPVSEVLATAGRGRGMAGGSRRLRG